MALGPRQNENRRYSGSFPQYRPCRMAPSGRSGRFPALPYPPGRRQDFNPKAVGPQAINPRRTSETRSNTGETTKTKGHGGWNEAYSNPLTWKWLLAQHKTATGVSPTLTTLPG